MGADKPEFSVRVEQGDAADRMQQMKTTIANLKEMLPYQLELQAIDAKMRKIKFDALIKEGFAVDQVLFLCK